MEPKVDELDAIASAAARISELIRSSDLTTPVPHLPRWKVRDVAAHLGGVHRWADRIVTSRSMSGPGFTKSKLDGIELCDWFDDGVKDLLRTLRSNDRHSPCPNFNPGSANEVAFWIRRQQHETIVHRWDIEQALGCPTGIDSAIAADGIDEFLDVFVRTRGKQTLIAPIILATTRPARAWTLSPATKPGRIDVAAGRTTSNATELSGPPSQLLLTLWGRLTISEAGLTVDGDPNIAASLTARP